MIQVIKLPQQPVFDVPRSIAGMEFMLTSIGGKLYLSKKQAMQALELTDSKTFNRHAQAISTPNLGGGMPSHPRDWLVYEIPVLYNTGTAGEWGGNGSTQLTKFYSPHNVFEIGLRTRNTPHKSMLMNWLVNIGNELVQQGFVIDQHAAVNDQNVVVSMQQQIDKLQQELEKSNKQANYWEYKYNDAVEYGVDQD